MDRNKLHALREAEYSIQPSCGLCCYGVFIPRGAKFGECTLVSYRHRKHNGSDKPVSIHISGRCSRFEPAEVRLELLGAFKEFYHE